MSIRVTVNPAARSGLKLVLGTLGAILLLALVAKLVGFRRSDASKSEASAPAKISASLPNPFLPAIGLCVDSSALESSWIAALASRLGGRAEVPIPNGRVDVVTETFAIEVERSAKWHEGIGQSLHYADATGLRPALAVIVDKDAESNSLRQLDDADRIATKQGIKVLVLISKCGAE